MATARKVLVDPEVTSDCPCILRCVRRNFLCGAENEYRKQQIEDRLRELVRIFAIDVCDFAILDNHLHVLLRLDLAKAKAWSSEEVVRHWVELCPPKDVYRKPVRVTEAWIRERANDLAWFMKSLKQPIARRANHDNQCTGAFEESRFRSFAVLNEAGLLATCAYFGVNPVAATVASLLEKSPHTSIKCRVDHCAAQRHLDTLRVESPYCSTVNVEQGHWLLPIAGRRDQKGMGLAGMLRGIQLPGYQQFIELSSRLIRPRKVNLSIEAPHILICLQIDGRSWDATLEKLIKTTKFMGTYFDSTTRLNETATQRGTKYLKNVTGRETGLTTPRAS